MEDDVITYRGTVYPWHCDHMGHMNVMWYVGKFDEAAWNLFGRVGLTPGYLREHGRGMAAVQQTIHYRRELVAGDLVAVESRVVELRPKAIVVEQTLLNTEHGHVAATMTLTGVHLDARVRRAVPFPEPVAARIHARLAPAPPTAALQA
jgi:acyl-CoA thioester hydrolase